MTQIKNFDALSTHLSKNGARKRVAVVCASDSHTQEAVIRALHEGLVELWFVGDTAQIAALPALKAFASYVHFVEASSHEEASQKAVALVKEGVAEVIMKGLLNTDVLLRALLNKECGIVKKGQVLSHITCVQMPAYERLLFFTDAAVIPYPTPEQREAQVAYIAQLCRAVGVEEPRIALLHCSEQINERIFPHTASYPAIIARAKEGAFGKCLVDGPLDLKTACNAESLRIKGIQSVLEGKADALVFPDIEAANAFYKTVTLFCHGTTASLLQGADVPVTLTSRGDSVLSKYHSLLLACAGKGLEGRG